MILLIHCSQELPNLDQNGNLFSSDQNDDDNDNNNNNNKFEVKMCDCTSTSGKF